LSSEVHPDVFNQWLERILDDVLDDILRSVVRTSGFSLTTICRQVHFSFLDDNIATITSGDVFTILQREWLIGHIELIFEEPLIYAPEFPDI
jgi:hypothetical protein